MTLPDGTRETDAERGELDMTRLKALYEEAIAGGFKYEMSITPDTVAVARRALELIILGLWRRRVFKIQYEGMSKEAVAAALEERKAKGGFTGGMPAGAKISAEAAVAAFRAGEKMFLPELKGEPLLVQMTRGGKWTTLEITTRQIQRVFSRAVQNVGFMPGTDGANNLRRGVMVGVQKGAERMGMDSTMHAKQRVNHRQPGHKAREKFYEDTQATDDALGAFLCGRMPQAIESLKGLSSQVVPEWTKYRTYGDVAKNDSVQKLLTGNEELKAYRRAMAKQEAALKAEPENAHAVRAAAILKTEATSLEGHLKRRVLYEKQMAVFHAGVAELETMPLEQVRERHEVNSYEGVTFEQVLLRYGCNEEVPFTVEAIVGERTSGKGKGKNRMHEYLLRWCGYKASRQTWEAAEAIEDTSLIESFREQPQAVHKAAPAQISEAGTIEVANAAVTEGKESRVILDDLSVGDKTAAMAEGLATPTVPRRLQSAAPSVRQRVHEEEEEMALSFRQLVALGSRKKEALELLATKLTVPVRTLEKKVARAVARAEGRLGKAGVGSQETELELNVDGTSVVLLCEPTTTMHELAGALARKLGVNPIQVRICADGERMALTSTVADAQAAKASLHAFTEQTGGGDAAPLSPGGTEVLSMGGSGSQESPVELSPERTEVEGVGSQQAEAAGSGSQESPILLLEESIEAEAGGSLEAPILLLADSEASPPKLRLKRARLAMLQCSDEVGASTPMLEADEADDLIDLTLDELRAQWARAHAAMAAGVGELAQRVDRETAAQQDVDEASTVRMEREAHLYQQVRARLQEQDRMRAGANPLTVALVGHLSVADNQDRVAMAVARAEAGQLPQNATPEAVAVQHALLTMPMSMAMPAAGTEEQAHAEMQVATRQQAPSAAGSAASAAVPPPLAQIECELAVRFAEASGAVRSKVEAKYKMLDELQRRALHGILVVKKKLTVVSGPAGAGKSALLKIVSLLEEPILAVAAPTNGAKRADQEMIDEALPRWSFKPRVEAKTTWTAWGVGFKEKWDAKAVVDAIKRKDPRKAKAEETYMKELLVCDEGAQIFFEQVDMALEVGSVVRPHGHEQRLVLLMDAVQTPPVVEKEKRRDNPGAEMIWDGAFYRTAEAAGELAEYVLENVYSTTEPKLKALAQALRTEDVETAAPLVSEFSETPYDSTFADIVHDNSEIYDVADEKFGGVPSVKVIHARCENPGVLPKMLSDWPSGELKEVREVSKMLVKLLVYEGQQMLYEPIGQANAKTDSGWYLGKGELVELQSYNEVTNQFRVVCPRLKGRPLAWIPEEFVRVNLPGHGSKKLWGPPLRYFDIVTVYSGQGSRYAKAHVRAQRFKGQRNLLYTACTRAAKVLKISGMALDDGGVDLENKMELHPKSVLWQAKQGVGGYSPERIEAAKLEVLKLTSRKGYARAGAAKP